MSLYLAFPKNLPLDPCELSQGLDEYHSLLQRREVIGMAERLGSTNPMLRGEMQTARLKGQESFFTRVKNMSELELFTPGRTAAGLSGQY